MVNFIILLILAFGFFMGMKRGFILQLLHLLGFLIAFIVAVVYYKPLAEKVSLFIPYPDLQGDSGWISFLDALPLEQGFYNAIAFAIIFFGVKIILQIVATMLDFVAALPILSMVNRILGAILGFVEVYLIVFVLLFILALTPLGFAQNWINESSVAQFIIEHTPMLSKKIVDLWFSTIGSL